MSGLSTPPGPLTLGRRPRRRWLSTTVILAVCVAVITAGVIAYSEIQAAGSAHHYPSPPPEWTTFLGAWSQVANAFAPFSNGSWSVHFAEGVAADEPWSPPAELWVLYGLQSWADCEQQLTGVSTLTFWNASEYPASQSSNDFTSGAAPLWTFIFNGSGTLTFVASWFQGGIILNAALNSTSSCLEFDIFSGTAYNWVDPAHELDSNAVAAEILQEDQYLSQNPVGDGNLVPMPVPPESGVALYFPGRELLPSTIAGGALWTVAYMTCGLPGSYGATSLFTGYLLNSTAISTAHSYQWISGPIACTDAEYFDSFNRTEVIGAPSGPGEYFEWRTSLSFMTSAVPPTWSLATLTTSQFGLELASPAPLSSSLPGAGELCGPGSRNLSSCPAPASGWYGVLLAPNGSWLDSYPTSPNGTSWSVDGVQVESGDLIAFVGSGGYPTTDTFGITSGIEPVVEGGDYLVGP